MNRPANVRCDVERKEKEKLAEIETKQADNQPSMSKPMQRLIAIRNSISRFLPVIFRILSFPPPHKIPNIIAAVCLLAYSFTSTMCIMYAIQSQLSFILPLFIHSSFCHSEQIWSKQFCCEKQEKKYSFFIKQKHQK